MKRIDFMNGNIELVKFTKPGSFHLNIREREPATEEEKQSLVRTRETVPLWQAALRRFARNRMAVASLIVIILLILFAFVGPALIPYSYDQQTRGHERLAPNAEHPFGTDKLGRDMLARTMIGTRISLLVGVFCAAIVLVIGVIYGSIAGYWGGRIDNVMMRVVEILYSVPDVLVIILLQISLNAFLKKVFPNSAGGTGIISIFIAFALLYWVNMARMTRSQVLLLKRQEYVVAAKAMGAGAARIIRKHLIPNSIGTITVTTAYQIPTAIFAESFLSFLGLGVSAPMASLGSLAADAAYGIESYPYLLIIPAAFLTLIILAFNLLGDGLRDALDPRMR